jgi:hypothetical protein
VVGKYFINCLRRKKKNKINLVSIFRHLQQKLDELKDYQSLSDEFILLTSKIDLEKSSSQRKVYTKKMYEEFLKNSKSTYLQLYLRLYFYFF